VDVSIDESSMGELHFSLTSLSGFDSQTSLRSGDVQTTISASSKNRIRQRDWKQEMNGKYSLLMHGTRGFSPEASIHGVIVPFLPA